MITFMRRYRRTLQVALFFVIAAFIGSLFIFGAMGPDGAGRDSVATVNGEDISTERYQRRYQEMLDMYAQVLRDRFSPEMAERFGLAQQVVDDLVQETLVAQRAELEGLAVGDDELNAQIHAIPAFHEGGRFTLKRYEDVLRRRGYSKGAFEQEMRRRLTRIKVERAVRSGVRVSDAEVATAFVEQREQIRAAWALVELAPFVAEITPSEAELTAYLNGHGDEFRLPERRRVQYVAFHPQSFRVAVSEADVEKHYAEHGAEFEEPRQVRAAHVLVRVAETGGSEAEDQAKAKIADVIRRARAGEDFAKLAREVSQDPGSAPRGGEIGFIKAGEVVPQFETALFALKKGEVSPEPVRTPFGFHAIKALEVREGGKKPLKAVAGQIRDRLADEAADRAARARAEEARTTLRGATDFLAEARKLGLTPVESTISRQMAGPAGLAPVDPLETTAFELAQGGVSTPVKTPAGWVVLKHVEHLATAVPQLAEIKDKVAAAVKREQAEVRALARAKQLSAEARDADLAAVAKKQGAVYGETARFSRSSPDKRLPGDAMMVALRTPAGTLSEPVKTGQGYYVLRVLERVPPGVEALAGERDKIAADLLARKQGLAWDAWVGAARTNAKIDISTRLPAVRG
jgi:peptidyl-prolyl cis-trans isomerase D